MKWGAIAIASVMLTNAALAQSEPSVWSQITLLDLRGVHDALRDNHPGPVDPENARYGKWLEEGLVRASKMAASVRSYSDYTRVLRYYTNAFQDGHLGVVFDVVPKNVAWPGFVAGADADGGAKVLFATGDAGVHAGDRITSCDGRTIDDLMKERVDPYSWNSAIPQERPNRVHWLFHLDPEDRQMRLAACRVGASDVKLQWRNTERAEFAKILDNARGHNASEPHLSRVGTIWYVTLPTLAFVGPANVEKGHALLSSIESNAAEMRRSTVVFDVRGNHGGDSAWAREIAVRLWGKEWVAHVLDGFDQTIDWRASPKNIAWLERMVDREKRAGLDAEAQEIARAVAAMKVAAAENRPLARIEHRPHPSPAPASTPITGRVFLLTDNECASACLDLADLLRRLPGVTHIGLPTSADAVYIDNTNADLPSGLGILGYSLKVYRNRVRGNNEWYEPAIRWPGGEMTDESVAKWIATLP
ncbi:MAG TPA: S41 family peptidase [Thermoanaerobaculia bacterium]|jgi:hypothetical protein